VDALLIERVGASGGDGFACERFLVRMERLNAAASKVGFDVVDDGFGADPIHALGQTVGDAGAEIARQVASVAVADRERTILPATAFGAARESSDGMDELMTGVGFPVSGLAATGDDDAGSGAAAFERHGCGEVHERGDRAEDALGVVDQADELAEFGLSAEIDGAVEFGVMISEITDLDKLDAIAEVVDDTLVALMIPPFDGDIELTARDDDPEWDFGAGEFADLGEPGPFGVGEVDIALKLGGVDGDVEFAGEDFGDGVEVMPGFLVGTFDEGNVAIDANRSPIGAEARYEGIMAPQLWVAGPNFGKEPVRVESMQVAHRCGEHDHIPQGVAIFEDDPGGIPRPHPRERPGVELRDEGFTGLGFFRRRPS